MALPFDQRLTTADKYIDQRIMIHRILVKKGKVKQATSPLPRIDIFMKEMYNVWNAGVIFDNILTKLQHENDGLIFTVKAAPYYPGTCEHIFKWKPMHLNTIDFNVVPLVSKHTQGACWYEHVWQLQTRDFEIFDFIVFSPEEDRYYRELSKQQQPLVLECNFDKHLDHPALAYLSSLSGELPKKSLGMILSGDVPEKGQSQGGWKVHRQRTDKPANAPKVARNILKTI